MAVGETGRVAAEVALTPAVLVYVPSYQDFLGGGLVDDWLLKDLRLVTGVYDLEIIKRL
jgi:hypothetical protein